MEYLIWHEKRLATPDITLLALICPAYEKKSIIFLSSNA